MAQGEGNIIIDVAGNTRQLEKDIAKVANQSINLNVKGFGQPLGKISGQLGEFEKSLAASNARVIAFGASAGAIFAIEKALADTVRTAIKVEKALADINVILGASSSSLRNFGGELFNIAKNTGQSFDAVSKAATELSRQGLGIEQTLKRTSDALILARLSGMDTVSTVEALTAAINSFSKSALDSTTIINKLAAVDAAFAVSSGDLAEAIKRVGSSAEDAGVSFDQLIAIVTSAQQITSRGGAVIGNSLKTIFTRLQRTDTLDALEQIGVATKDAQGNILPLMNILNSLATTYDKLNTVQKASIAETVGGVFQINVLKAALNDLNSQYSIYTRALETSSGATDEAITRNEQLNQTLEALINKTIQNFTKFGAAVGQDVFGPALKKVLGGLNTALESFGEGDSQDVGSRIGKGLLKGLGDFLAGPGLAIGGLALFKIFERLTVFTADAFKSLTGLNSKAAEQKVLQSQILSILSKNPEIIKQINNGETSLLQVHKTLLSLIEQETVALTKQAAIAQTLSQTLYGSGVRVAKTGPTKGLPTKYDGFIPNYSLSEELSGVQRSSDYSRSEKNKARPFLTNLNGEMVYANNQEMKVPAKSIYKKMGLPDGTKPKNPSEKYGILNPKQQKLLGFSGGFIPNFKNPNKLSADQLVNQINTLSSVKNIPINEYDPNNAKMRLDALKNSIQGFRELKAAVSTSEDFSGKKYVENKLEEESKDLKDRYDNQKERYRKSLYEYKDIFSAVRAEMDMKEEYARGFIPNFQDAGPVQVSLNKLDPTISSKYGVLVGKGGSGSVDYTQGVADIPSLKNVLPKGSGVSVKLRQRSAFPLTTGGINESEKEFDKLLQSAIGPGLQSFAQNIGQNILGKNEPVQSFVTQLGADVKGSLFEKSVRAALIDPKQVDRIPSDNAQAAFDFDPASSFLGFQELFGLKNVKAVEAKVSDEAAKSGRLPNKVLSKEDSLVAKIIQQYGKKPNKFKGFIPNFEDDLDQARKEAFDREKSASGLSSNQIKLVKDRRLKNRLNPYGEAVINKRDEPSGTAGEGIKRFKSLGDARKAGMPDMRWTGYIPNFAKGRPAKQPKKGSEEALDTAPVESALSKFQDKALFASFAFSTLGGVVGEFAQDFNPKAKNYVDALSSGVSAFSTLAGIIPGQAGLIIGAVAGLGIAIDKTIKTFNEKAPALEASLEYVKDENQKFGDSTSRYLETYTKLNDSLSDTEGDQEKITQNIIKLNKELANIAFELPEKYRAEILSIQDSTELQNRIGEIRKQQLEKEKALLTATNLQKKIDQTEGLGKMFLGMGQNVLNKPGETRRLGGDVTGDIGKENLVKLAQSNDLVTKSQQDLITEMEKTYGMSEDLGGVLRQLSDSDFAGFRSVLISSANDIKNTQELTEALNKSRKEEQDKIRALNKAISESKAKIADLSKTMLDDLVRTQARAQTQRSNRREILAKDFESRTEINKQFQNPENQAMSQYFNETVKSAKESQDKIDETLAEGNKGLLDKLQEFFNTNKETGGGQISPEAQIAVLEKLRKDFNEKTVTPDVLARQIEEILKSQNINKDELEKLRKENEKQTKETNAKLDAIKDQAVLANKLQQLALKYAQQQNQIAKDLKAGGGYESFLNPEKDKAEFEQYIKNNQQMIKNFLNPQSTTGQMMPIQQARNVAQQVETEKNIFGLEPTQLESNIIQQGISRQMGEKYQGFISETDAVTKAYEKNREGNEVKRRKTMEASGIPMDSGEGANILDLNKNIQKSIEKSGKLEGERRDRERQLREEQILFDPNKMSQDEQDKNKAKQEQLKKEIEAIAELEQDQEKIRKKQEDYRKKQYDELVKEGQLSEDNRDLLEKADETVESQTKRIESLKIKRGEAVKESTPEALARKAKVQTEERLKTQPLTEGGYQSGVERIVDAIKGGKTEGEEKDLPTAVGDAIKQAAEDASAANVQSIKDAFATLKEQEKAADQAKKDAETESKKIQKEIEAKQAEGKTAASKEALKASSKSLFGAKAGAYNFFESDETRAARMSAGAKDIPQVIDKALKENPNINSTEDLIKELKTNKEFGAKITAGTSIAEGDLQTELESAVAKKGKEQREGAFVGGIDAYIQNSRNEQKLKSEAASMQPQPVMPMQAMVDPMQKDTGTTMIGMPTQQAYPFQDNSFMDYQAPQLPTSTIGMSAPINPIEDFFRNPPAEQPAGPLTPQPQTTESRIGLGMTGTLGANGASVQGNTSAQFDDIMKMEEEKSKKNWARIQANAEQDGGLSASYAISSKIGEMADADLKAQSRKNEEGGRYLDKKYGLGDASEETKKNQVKGTAKLTEDKRETSKQKQEETKANAEMKASLENLSAQINANTEVQKKASEDKKEESKGEVKGEGEIKLPEIKFSPMDININVQGSIDQIPTEASTKTVQAIKDVVNQILPGEISKRLGALKA
jgi:TP901 family phage tail tape measure protein